MMPYFHAAGHLHYAKAAHMYIMEMERMEKNLSPNEYDKFAKQGQFSIKRTENPCTGTWSDKVIEETLMRSMKTSGGITRGRGITQSVLSRWILAMPKVVETSENFERFTEKYFYSSEQHANLTTNRRFVEHVNIFFHWLEQHTPFLDAPIELVNIHNGIIATPNINCYNAKHVGLHILNSIEGKTFSDLKLKRSERVKTLALIDAKTASMKNKSDSIKSEQLFHRILCTMKNETDLKECLKHELSGVPPSLYDDICMRKGTKSKLAHILQNKCESGSSITELPQSSYFVIDGGFLIHQVLWQNNITFFDLYTRYFNYVLNITKTVHTTIVFDGYSESSTKDSEHRRRYIKKSPDVNINSSIAINWNKQEFLANEKNKQNFILHLGSFLSSKGIHILNSLSDADSDVAKEAIKMGKQT